MMRRYRIVRCAAYGEWFDLEIRVGFRWRPCDQHGYAARAAHRFMSIDECERVMRYGSCMRQVVAVWKTV